MMRGEFFRASTSSRVVPTRGASPQGHRDTLLSAGSGTALTRVVEAGIRAESLRAAEQGFRSRRARLGAGKHQQYPSGGEVCLRNLLRRPSSLVPIIEVKSSMNASAVTLKRSRLTRRLRFCPRTLPNGSGSVADVPRALRVPTVSQAASRTPGVLCSSRPRRATSRYFRDFGIVWFRRCPARSSATAASFTSDGAPSLVLSSAVAFSTRSRCAAATLRVCGK